MQPEIEFLPAVLEIQENPPSPVGRAIAWTIMLFFATAMVWAFTGEIDIVASAQGKIIPGGRVKIIQPLEIGVVRTIYIREGQSVKAGDPLIELDATATRAELGELEKKLFALRLDHARYHRLSQMTESAEKVDTSISPPPYELESDPEKATAEIDWQLQQKLLASQWQEHAARLAALDSTIKSREADLAAIREQIKKFEATLPLITRRAEALKQMVDKKLGPEQTWLELEEQRLTQKQDLAALRNQTIRIQSSIHEAENRRKALVSEFRREILEQLADTGHRIEQLEQQIIKAKQRSNLQTLTAPVTGVVQQLAIHTLGGVVMPAQELMKIVPLDRYLEVEAWILNKDIGFVEPGQKAEIKIETFPFTRYGIIDAEILDVSDDAVSNDKLGLVYVAKVGMARSTIRVGYKSVNLTSGMAVTVEIKTGTRRLIEFVLSPLLQHRDESFKER